MSNKSIVYFTKEINKDSLVKIYEKLGVELKGRVAVKLSSGEPGGHNFLSPSLIKDLVQKLDGTIVECCTAYKGKRYDADSHIKVMEEHGFSGIASCDVMDSVSEMELHFEGGKHLKGINYVGSNLAKYDSMLMLSHFKGHAMGGFGGALKNMSIGIASRNGKAWIHTVGTTNDPEVMWNYVDDQDGFLESMAEACKSVMEYFKSDNIVYINVLNNISIDCDCDSNPRDPEMADIGIMASLDPVALDKCCYDAIMNSSDKGKESLVNRMKEKNAIHIVEASEQLGLGTTNYEIISID